MCLLVISKSHPWLNYWHPPGSYRLCFSTEGGDTHTHTNSLPVPFNQHVWYCHRILYDPYFALYHVVRQKRYFTVGAFFMQTRGRIPGNRFQLNLVEVFFFLKRKKTERRSISATGTWHLPVDQTDDFVSGSCVHSPCNFICVLCVTVRQGVESHAASWRLTDTQCAKHTVSWKLLSSWV